MEPELPLLSEPADGVPAVTDTPDAVERAGVALRDAGGPVAVDAERSSGHRYGQRAFLIQLRRIGAGTFLIDPEAVSDLSDVAQAIEGAEWILHSATQDLPCLAEAGLRPTRLFDTELAARLLNLPRVGLAGITESLLGVRLSKGYSAADWSRRPLPAKWLRYAALDVEVLHDLRDILAARLRDEGKDGWAEQEFAYLTTWSPADRQDPWRRTSGLNKLRSRRDFAIVRSLWQAREAEAQEKDRAPGRVVPDSALVAAARAKPSSITELLAVPGFGRRRSRSYNDRYLHAIAEASALAEEALPPIARPADGPPPPRSWRDPDLAAGFARCRAVVVEVAEEQDLPPEVLISPDCIRRLAWQPPQPATRDAVATILTDLGARPWQRDLLSERLAEALQEG